MKLLGWDIGRKTPGTAVVPVEKAAGALAPVSSRNTFWGFIRESFAGAWQANIVVNRDEVISYFAVYSCISLIAQDIAKMRIKLVELTDGIWQEITLASHTPVLRKPNRFQTRIKFFESWILSKLLTGNAYILKQRDNRDVVVALYVLDPLRVTALVSESGDVYYNVKTDYLSGIAETDITIPASEIIHDTCVTLFHPLLGVSPLFACGLAATQGIKIQTNSTKLFSNMSRPSGVLSAPGAIGDDTAARIKEHWDTNYTGENMGKTAVLGDGLQYYPMTINPADAQLIEQLKMTAEVCCSVFHVPPYMVGIGAMPSYNNIEALNQQYYSQALQAYIEQIELLLDEGLGLVTSGRGTEFDLDGLLRMDTAARYKAHQEAIGAGWMAPNEARKKEGYKPAVGGDTPYLQQQNFSLAALSKRDTSDDPFKTSTPPTAPAPKPGAEPKPGDEPAPGDEAPAEPKALLTLFEESALDGHLLGELAYDDTGVKAAFIEDARKAA